MATFTQLQDTDFIAIASDIGIGAVRRWTPLPAGTVNSNFSLHTDAGRFAVRVNEGKSRDEVSYEAELVEALARGGVPAPAPLRSRAGTPYVLCGPHLVSVFPWVVGEHRRTGDITDSDARAVGRALARLHVVGQDVSRAFERAGRYTFERICERVADIEARTRDNNAERTSALAPALDAVRSEIAWLIERAPLRAAATRGVIHGDLFPDNVLFEGERLVALIDFEQASTGSLCYDLAVCLNAWCFDRDIEPALVRAMIAGYQTERALPPADVRALPVEVRAAAMRFTVTRITDVYLAGEDKPDKHFGHFLRRLERWREIGPGDLLRWGQLGE